MKASVRLKYGGPDVLSIQEMDVPVPKDNEVLIKVGAATVNRSDHHVLTGKPLIMRLFTGLFKPTLAVTGSDFAGMIKSIGKNVTSFKPGDRVMGFIDMGSRSHAQYLSIEENKIIAMPANVGYDEAAACLEGAFYALNAIIMVKPMEGQKAMVYGATGAIGTSYIQFLKYYNVYITAVCERKYSELVRSLGADKIIDYTTEDFTKDNEEYDFIFDAVGKISYVASKHLLKKKGIYVFSDGFYNVFLSLVTPLTGGKKVIFPIPKNLIDCLLFIKDLVEKEKFKPVIDRKFPLAKIAEAYEYVGSGKKIGNVIITMDD